MTRNHWQSLLSRWADALRSAPDRSEIIRKAGDRNPWFGPQQVEDALSGISEGLLKPSALEAWLTAYPHLDEQVAAKTVGLVLAGNLPLVGFHDVLCVLVAGHRAQIKLSAKDPVLLPWALDLLLELEPELAGRWTFAERLQHYDAVIATGSDNSNRYFLHYFRHVPHLLRGNRTSAAILQGDETADELEALGRDIFQYFGLGCRSVSHLFLAKDVDITKLLDALEPFAPILEHARYRHNFDYQRTLLLLNRTQHLGSDFLSIVENPALVSPISVLHYTRFQSPEELGQLLEHHREGLQVVVGRAKGLVPFGRAQQPGPADYADQKDTLAFLAKCF
ncbi:MAG: acyl-CoA reductase [Bacteroidetes bacterium]|nr:acyl-CoA reductase [Bacteroidota bacterium]